MDVLVRTKEARGLISSDVTISNSPLFFSPPDKCVFPSVRTTNTVYSDNAGDGVYDVSGSKVGVRVQLGGCFAPTSSSLDAAVQDYINSNICP